MVGFFPDLPPLLLLGFPGVPCWQEQGGEKAASLRFPWVCHHLVEAPVISSAYPEPACPQCLPWTGTVLSVKSCSVAFSAITGMQAKTLE